MIFFAVGFALFAQGVYMIATRFASRISRETDGPPGSFQRRTPGTCLQLFDEEFAWFARDTDLVGVGPTPQKAHADLRRLKQKRRSEKRHENNRKMHQQRARAKEILFPKRFNQKTKTVSRKWYGSFVPAPSGLAGAVGGLAGTAAGGIIGDAPDTTHYHLPSQNRKLR